MPIVTFVTLIHHDHSLGLGLFPMHEAFGPIVRQLRHSAMREPLLCIQNGTYIYHNPHIGEKGVLRWPQILWLFHIQNKPPTMFMPKSIQCQISFIGELSSRIWRALWHQMDTK
jgi:hypothetical protein